MLAGQGVFLRLLSFCRGGRDATCCIITLFLRSGKVTEINRPAKRIDVARKVGVSVGAVSQVLNNTPGTRIRPETRKRIIEAAAELHYVPSLAARALKSGRSNIVAVVLCSSDVLFDQYCSGVLYGIWGELVKKKLKLCIDILNEDLDATELFRSKIADGIIFIAPSRKIKNLKTLAKAGFPVVCLGDCVADVPTDYVDIDNFQSAHDAVKHMLDNGFDKFIIMRGPCEYSCTEPRMKGALKALEEAGIFCAPENIIESEFSREKSKNTMLQLLQKSGGKPEFNAVFCASDEIGFGCIDAFHEVGITPGEDIAVMGINGFGEHFLSNNVSSMKQPLPEIGAEAARLLLARIEDRTRPVCTKFFSTELIVAQSTVRKGCNNHGKNKF